MSSLRRTAALKAKMALQLIDASVRLPRLAVTQIRDGLKIATVYYECILLTL